MDEISVNRVIAYIDGYNLYHGLKDKGWQKYYWLDISALMNSYIGGNRVLQRIYYFTSPSPKPDSEKRQRVYIKALETQVLKTQELNSRLVFKTKLGHFKKDSVRCTNCNDFARCAECEMPLVFHHEKETDVNITVQMMSDAYEDYFDTAFLVTGDSDQVGTVETIYRLFEDKKVYVIFPPGRFSNELQTAARNNVWNMGEKKLRKCQLPECIISSDGYELKRPNTWT